jgi:hypothetical protein
MERHIDTEEHRRHLRGNTHHLYKKTSKPMLHASKKSYGNYLIREYKDEDNNNRGKDLT